MTLLLSGTTGVSDVDGSASTPAIRGTDTNTGIFFPSADTIAFAEGGTEVMRIDSSGHVTKPFQPSFFAYSSNSTFNTGTATDLKITYNLTAHNIGSHYNTSNGRFTAPIAGRYLISVNTTMTSGSISARYIRTQLWKNGSNSSIPMAGHNHASNESGDGDYHQVIMTGVIELAANDYVEVYWATSASANQIQLAGFDTNVTFSGQLLG